VQSGSRSAYEFLCAAHQTPPPYALSRSWDIAGVSFDVVGRDGEVQHFANWENAYTTLGSVNCGRLKGFRLTSWRHPNGIVDRVAYGDPFDINAVNPLTGIERITQVTSSLGRQINFDVDSTRTPTGFDNALSGADARSVSWSQATANDITGPQGAPAPEPNGSGSLHPARRR
jgi:hypothetical protein